MSVLLSPYVNFAGNCKEAMEFYQSVFGGERDFNTFASFGQGDGTNDNQIMHSTLKNDVFSFMGSDAPFDNRVEGTNIHLSIGGDESDGERLTSYFNGLAASGSITMPLEKAQWGDTFGMCKDKYGINWMINFGKGMAS